MIMGGWVVVGVGVELCDFIGRAARMVVIRMLNNSGTGNSTD